MRTTDMADELFSGAAQPLPAGVRLATARHGGVTVTRVEIAREGLSRPRGRYVTLEMPSVSVLDERDAAVIEVCAQELRALLPPEGPVLVLGITCSCLATFLGSIYMVERQSVHTLTTTLLGAFLNIGLNLLTIPRMGVMGAALSTCLSYLLMFLVRGIHTRKYIPVSWRLHKFLPSCVLVVLQAALMLWEVPLWPLWQILCFLLITLLNIKELFRSLLRLF